MKIGINTFGCDHGRSGVGSYILSLVRNLPKSEHIIQLFGHELDKYTYTSGLEGVKYTCVPLGDSELAEQAWHRFSFNAFVRKQHYDTVLFPSGTQYLPMYFDVPAVLVVQNMPATATQSYLQSVYSFMSKLALKSVKGIISPSKHIRNSLLRAGVTEAKIKVIHNGVDTSLFHPHSFQGQEALTIKPFAIRRPYILYVSRIMYPEKRHVELIDAFSLFKQKTKAPHRLVMVGQDGNKAEYVHQAVLRSPFASDILLTGYFPHENLPLLYAAADLSVFPSSAEGVGLPVVEAMACGIPTACARAGALPEIAGDCTCYFDPTAPEDIAAVIESLVTDPLGVNAERRQHFIDAGLEWVKQYSWKKTAEQTLLYVESLNVSKLG